MLLATRWSHHPGKRQVSRNLSASIRVARTRRQRYAYRMAWSERRDLLNRCIGLGCCSTLDVASSASRPVKSAAPAHAAPCGQAGPLSERRPNGRQQPERDRTRLLGAPLTGGTSATPHSETSSLRLRRSIEPFRKEPSCGARSSRPSSGHLGCVASGAFYGWADTAASTLCCDPTPKDEM
jgi:hypothetical protein